MTAVIRNIAGMRVYSPTVILQDLATALQFFSDMFANPFGVALYLGDMTIEIGDVGLHVVIDDETIFISQVVYDSDLTTDSIDLGEFAFDKKNDAIDLLIATIATTLYKEAGENRMDEALAVEMGEI